ncbi:MAG: hypothetical protein M1821_009309 [Bathelium mastoideum]|nr:MAG: hypothetical protein M1821_009309 [Bathelium mastoideum]
MAAMLTSSPIPNSVYNTLPAIEDQSPPSENVLRDIGHIFLNHGINEDIGISLLHKHFMLDNEEVMVHDGLRCSPALPGISGHNLEGSAFFLHGNKFEAFEYEHSEALDLSKGFLQEMERYLLANQLQLQLAISKLDKEHPKLMEHCEDGKTHVCEVIEAEIPLAEATEWKFEDTNGSVVPVIVRGCGRTSSGDHKPKEMNDY